MSLECCTHTRIEMGKSDHLNPNCKGACRPASIRLEPQQFERQNVGILHPISPEPSDSNSADLFRGYWDRLLGLRSANLE